MATGGTHAGASVGERVRRDRVAPTAIGGVLAAGTGLVVLMQPQAGGPVLCPLLALTGLYCPMCGGLRTTAALAHADVAAAWSVNPMLTVLLPLAAVAWAVWMVRSWRGQSPLRIPDAVYPALAVAVVVFGVLRNIPFLAPFLSP
ncbi:DUF2752 domain-containing protein [Ruania alkalisoli]|uniref:DUF2752 domain-containing protein n=1 Tax=Ruania alkalisoli TaxID=2779775 RepID=A0A7M1T014_9MICO|nr:DUF2752 domain-containing protein [Ruania alkalisoli]QOR72322.1 DUF2752 domain-containing protein [Ruania alkalisoli]